MRVLILASLTAATGNEATVRRLGALMQLHGNHHVLFRDCNTASTLEVLTYIENNYVDVIVAVHAYRAGRHVLQHIYNSSRSSKAANRTTTGIPVILVLSGTDVNEDIRLGSLGDADWAQRVTAAIAANDATHAEEDAPSSSSSSSSSYHSNIQNKSIVSMLACHRAAVIIAFTEDMRQIYNQACASLPPALHLALISKVRVIQQAVMLEEVDEKDSKEAGGRAGGGGEEEKNGEKGKAVSTTTSETITNTTTIDTHQKVRTGTPPPSSSLREELHLPLDSFIVLLVCGLREVKDPTFVYDAFQEWWREAEQEQEQEQSRLKEVDSQRHEKLHLASPAEAPSSSQKMNTTESLGGIVVDSDVKSHPSSSSSPSSSSPPRQGGRRPLPYLVTIGPTLVPSIEAAVRSRTCATWKTSSSSSSSSSSSTASETFTKTSTPNVCLPQAHTPFGGHEGLLYHPSVPRPRLLQYIQQSDVLLNTSISEGQCNAILEAMLLKCPVVARRNPGNSALIKNTAKNDDAGDATGVLFDTSKECIEWCKQLYAEKYHHRPHQRKPAKENNCDDFSGTSSSSLHMNNNDTLERPMTLASQMTRNAYEYVRAYHSPEVEGKAWEMVLQEVLARGCQ